MRNVLRSVRLAALVLPLAGWIVAKEPHSQESFPSRTGESISANRKNAGSMKGLQKLDQAAQTRLMESYGKLPLSFEANRGQMDSGVNSLRGAAATASS